jgi:hypothetical protein
MRGRCSVLVLLVLFVLLAFGASLAVPAEDIPETPYDESESVPYQVTPLFSIVALLVASRTTQAPLRSLDLKLGAPSLFPSARVRDTDAHRSDTRISLALFCTLLC